eukprot:Skav227052  [mRNA]  locus=scaffold72:777020:788648:- [translate_table: standard]
MLGRETDEESRATFDCDAAVQLGPTEIMEDIQDAEQADADVEPIEDAKIPRSIEDFQLGQLFDVIWGLKTDEQVIEGEEKEAYQQDQKYQKDEQRLKGFDKLAEKLRFSSEVGTCATDAAEMPRFDPNRHCPELGNKGVEGGILGLLQLPQGQAAVQQLAQTGQEADWRECHRQVVAQRLFLDHGANSAGDAQENDLRPVEEPKKP